MQVVYKEILDLRPSIFAITISFPISTFRDLRKFKLYRHIFITLMGIV